MGGDASPKRLLVGRIGSAHGIKGGVRIASFTQDPLAIAQYGPLSTNRPGLIVTITDAKMMKATVIARLKGVSDRNTAETLKGVELYIERDALPPVEDDDEFYHADLLNLEARLEDASVLGTVVAVLNYGAGDILEVRDPKTGVGTLYPFTKAVVPTISLAGGYLVIVPPSEIETAPDGRGDDGDGGDDIIEGGDEDSA